jgi:hypothetical protein
VLLLCRDQTLHTASPKLCFNGCSAITALSHTKLPLLYHKCKLCLGTGRGFIHLSLGGCKCAKPQRIPSNEIILQTSATAKVVPLQARLPPPPLSCRSCFHRVHPYLDIIQYSFRRQNDKDTMPATAPLHGLMIDPSDSHDATQPGVNALLRSTYPSHKSSERFDRLKNGFSSNL